jgi:hypothetical protein
MLVVFWIFSDVGSPCMLWTEYIVVVVVVVWIISDDGYENTLSRLCFEYFSWLWTELCLGCGFFPEFYYELGSKLNWTISKFRTELSPWQPLQNMINQEIMNLSRMSFQNWKLRITGQSWHLISPEQRWWIVHTNLIGPEHITLDNWIHIETLQFETHGPTFQSSSTSSCRPRAWLLEAMQGQCLHFEAMMEETCMVVESMK